MVLVLAQAQALVLGVLVVVVLVLVRVSGRRLEAIQASHAMGLVPPRTPKSRRRLAAPCRSGPPAATAPLARAACRAYKGARQADDPTEPDAHADG